LNSKNTEIIHVLANAIVEAAREIQRTASFNITKEGHVTKILGNNTYEISMQGAVYTVPCCTDQVFSIADKVLVLIIQNDAKRKYIIGRG